MLDFHLEWFEGQRSLLRHMIVGRFGTPSDAVASCLESASVSELEQWVAQMIAGEDPIASMPTVGDRSMEEESEDGRVEGKVKDRLAPQRRLMRRVLVCRFGALPEGVRSRLEAASIGELEPWVERMRGAKTLAEVVGNDSAEG